MKSKCSICKAKSVDKRNYRGKQLCPECHYEYAAIFDGWQSNKSKKAFNMKKAWNTKYHESMELWNGFFGIKDDGIDSQ